MNTPLRLSVDEHGRVLQGERRLDDPAELQIFFQNLKVTEHFSLQSVHRGQACLVEAFDAPWVLIDLKISPLKVVGLNTYGYEIDLDLSNCYFDPWDRLNGETQQKIPWVLSRAAQEKIFAAFDDYDDDGFTLMGRPYKVHSEYQPPPAIDQSDWWSRAYQEGRSGWNLQAPHPSLADMHPRLKQPKSRILVLGCGEGHDAAFFAKEGHVVTAVDFSKEAIERAKSLYGNLGIEFLQKDIFELPPSMNKSFDFIFEHTLYCAIPPERRPELVQVWNRCLVPGGYLMGVFFTMEKRFGPPFGAREWEIRERLQKHYHMLFWGRWKNSPGWREGVELFVLAQKRHD